MPQFFNAAFLRGWGACIVLFMIAGASQFVGPDTWVDRRGPVFAISFWLFGSVLCGFVLAVVVRAFRWLK